jgi:hypothetical protein
VGTVIAQAINKPTNTIEVNGGTIRADRIRLWSGLSNGGVPALLSTTSDAQITSAIVGITPAFATSTTADTNSVALQGKARLLSRGNVEIRSNDVFSTRATADDSGAGAGDQHINDYVERTRRGSAQSVVRILSIAPIPGSISTTESNANSITISDTAIVQAGLQSNLQLHVLPAGLSANEINGYLKLSGAGFSRSLTDGDILTDAEKTALGIPVTSDYTYRLLPAPAALSPSLAGAVGVILPQSLWDDPTTRPELILVDLASTLAQEYNRLNALISDYIGAPATLARYLAQREEVLRQARDLGFVDATGVFAEERQTLAVRLPDLQAAPGSVFLDAPNGVISSGGVSLASSESPSAANIRVAETASIQVSNAMPVLLLGQDMVINDSAQVDVIGGQYTLFTPGRLLGSPLCDTTYRAKWSSERRETRA